MISWTILAVAVGLIASLGSFFMALYKLRSEVTPFKSLTEGLRWVAIATLLLYVCLIGAGTYAYLESQKNHHALCSLRADLDERVTTGETYLKAHPEGFAGVSATQIQETIDNQKRTIEALSNLAC